MQSTFHIISDSYNFPFSWRPRKTHFTIQNPTLKTPPRLFPQTVTFSNSLKLSYNHYESEEVGPSTVAQPLPVAIPRPGVVSRYFWDGNCLKLVPMDGGNSSINFYREDGFGEMISLSSLAVRNFFIPERVNENYLDYVKWKFLHRVFSSALQVLATQAMFRAIGIGYSRSLPSAAALNWVLKDGLGRLCRCIYTACLASAFDTNLKRVRFSTSVLFSLSIGVEMLTPAFPQYFLLLASIANIAKQISLACYLATNSAVHQSFAIADNLGEVSAKAQIQTVCFDILGLMLAALLNILCRNNQRLQAGLPFVAFPIFTAIDLFGIYQGLKHVHLQTLTKDRLEIIINTWIELGYVPSPAQVSKEEGIDFLWRKGRKEWPIRIGCLDVNNRVSKLSMLTMQSLSNEDFYFICTEISRSGHQGILVCVREGASTTDAITGLLQACYFRKRLVMRQSNITESSKSLVEVIEESKQCAQADLKVFNEQMAGVGWSVKNILLSIHERARYSFIED